jgi:hypothetical protein
MLDTLCMPASAAAIAGMQRAISPAALPCHTSSIRLVLPRSAQLSTDDWMTRARRGTQPSMLAGDSAVATALRQKLHNADHNSKQ